MKYLLIIVSITLFSVAFIIFHSLKLPDKIRKIEELINNGELSKANGLLKRIIEKKKNYIPAKYLKARILIQQKQYLLAISEINSILTMNDFNRHVKELELRYHLTNLYHELKNWKKEIEEYKLILTINPNDTQANSRIGISYYHEKKYKLAKQHLSKALKIDPNKKDIYLPLGISCFKISDYKQAESVLLKALNNPIDKIEAQYTLGLIYKLKKDIENATLMFTQASKNSKYFLDSLFNLGELYFQTGNFKEALTELEKGIEKISYSDESALPFRYLLAETYENNNKINEAINQWEIITTIKTNYRSTKQKLKSYKDLVSNPSLNSLFSNSIKDLQPLISDIITFLNFNILSKNQINHNEYKYKAYNIKRPNDPPIIIYFNRTTQEIIENIIISFEKELNYENFKSGIYITTSNFSLKAKTFAESKSIELYDSKFILSIIKKIEAKKRK